MTDRQKHYIETLAAERDLGDTPKGRYLVRYLAGEPVGEPTTAQASAIIEWLLTLPRVAAAPAVTTADPIPPAGRYALVADDGAVKFYVVDRPTDGHWAGRTFLSALGSGERYPIRNRDERNRILRDIADDVDEARIRYAMELGRCGCCGRALTDEVSRAAGIGPDCADRYGIDRSVYADRARRMMADRILGRVSDDRLDGEDDGINLAPSTLMVGVAS